MSPGETPPWAQETAGKAGRAKKKIASRNKALELPAPAKRTRASSRFMAPPLDQDLDLVMRPTNPGPESDPSSWRTKSTESPLQVRTTLLSPAFQVQACVSPMIVKLAFPPERSSRTTLPADVLYVPSRPPPLPQATPPKPKPTRMASKAKRMCCFMMIAPLQRGG